MVGNGIYHRIKIEEGDGERTESRTTPVKERKLGCLGFEQILPPETLIGT
jgi:hypothetical protein